MSKISLLRTQSHNQVPSKWKIFLAGMYIHIVRSPQNGLVRFHSLGYNHTVTSSQSGIDFGLEI